MKKILIVFIILIALGLVLNYSYNYLLGQKLTEDFLQQLTLGEMPDAHSQQTLIMELIELEIAQEMYIKSRKNSFKGLNTTVGMNLSGHEFTFQLVVGENEVGKREVQIKNMNMVSGYLAAKQKTDTHFVYEIQINGDKNIYTSPLEIEATVEEVVRLLIIRDEVAAVSPLEEVNISKVLSYTGDSITGELEGDFYFSESVMRFGEETRLYVGQEHVDIYIKNNLVVGIVTREEFIPEKIRVLINDTGFNNLNHNHIKLYSDQKMEIYSKVTDSKIVVEGNTPVVFQNNNSSVIVTIGDRQHQFTERIYIESEGGKFYFDSIKRGANNQLNPGYRGNLEIFTMDNNMYLINELPLEQYLFGVVPSEMPSSFGLEALKIQAIAARTYAANNVYSSSYRRYTAHVVDSVLNQVYNNTVESPLANSAVEETKGNVITYQGNIIDAKFFSTSSGFTAMSSEVWDAGGQFPSSEVPYLVSKAQGFMDRFNIGTEKAFQDFITNKDIPSFDSESPFYRWEIEMSSKQLEKSIENNLAARHRAQPNSVLTLENGDYVSKEIPQNPIGSLKELKVVERGKGGNIMILDIIAQNGTYRVIKEYNIRFTIRPVCNENPVSIVRNDGSILQNYSILPSAFIYFDHIYQGDTLKMIKMHGGGNGHGVGMSQYGVLGMINGGFDQNEIISHYYEGAQISWIY